MEVHCSTFRSSTCSTSDRSQPPRRRMNKSRPWLRRRQTSLSNSYLLIFLVFSCCLCISSATILYGDEVMIEARDHVETLESTYARLARSGTILVDRSPPPMANVGYMSESAEDAAEGLRRRAASSSSNANASNGSVATATAKNSSASATTPGSSTPIAVATPTGAVDLPSPFDLGFSGNITNNCNSFMTSMLTNTTFQSCLPISLLLRNSNSFFQVEKSVTRISQTLDYTCAANVTLCSKLMIAFASNITTDSACSADLAAQNPIISDAHLGLLAYKPLYSASCLRNPVTTAYCFAEAITNNNNSADAYVYYLPLNNSLVGGSQPTCNSCLKSTMAVFEAATSDRKNALASVYPAAASQVNVNCGPGYVNASLAAPISTSRAMPTTGPGYVWVLPVVMLGLSCLL